MIKKTISPPVIIIVIFFLLASCSSLQEVNNEKVPVIKHKDDLISVSATLDLSRASYLRGCIEQMKECGLKPSFESCLKKAKNFVQEDVIFILNQE